MAERAWMHAVICVDCDAYLHASGRAWCSTGQHVVAESAMGGCTGRVNRRCRACGATLARHLSGYVRPEGYVPLSAVAQAQYVSIGTIKRWIQKGWHVTVLRDSRGWWLTPDALTAQPPLDQRSVRYVERERLAEPTQPAHGAN